MADGGEGLGGGAPGDNRDADSDDGAGPGDNRDADGDWEGPAAAPLLPAAARGREGGAAAAHGPAASAGQSRAAGAAASAGDEHPGMPRHRRARSDGATSAAAATSALLAFNAAGESAAMAERGGKEDGGGLGEIELSQAGVGLAEGWARRLVEWAVREAAQDGGGEEGEAATQQSFATLIAHVMDHSTVFREAEHVAFVAATLDSLPLEDASARVGDLIAMHAQAKEELGADPDVAW